jgi:hypothetical protein
MLARLKSRITYANVVASIALFVSLSTGAVYAANEWTGANIVDGSLTGSDLAMNTVGGPRIKDDTVTADDLAASSVASSEIVDGSVTSADLGFSSVTSSQIATDAVNASEIADNSIDSGEIVDNSLTLADLKGADKNGSVSFSAGAVANGRCRDFDVSVSGASTNEAVIFSLKGPAPEGMIFYGVRVKSAGVVVLAVCNFTGGTSPAITSLPVRVVTFG